MKYGDVALDNYYNFFKISSLKEKLNYKKIKFSKSLKLQNISFSYKNQKLILNNINLNIEKGKIIGICGKSGEGKTTLIDIIIGLLKPLRGNILIDDFKISDNLFKIRNLFSYVPQEPLIINDSIKNNIFFSYEKNQNYNKEDLNFATQISDLNSFVKKSNRNISAKTGEKGSKLSGGQKQKINIARAIYADSEILILDEFTSSLDKYSEKKILKNLKKLSKIKKKTIVIISHKKSTLEICDEIFLLKNRKLNKISYDKI